MRLVFLFVFGRGWVMKHNFHKIFQELMRKNGKAHFKKGITLMHLKCNLCWIMDTVLAFSKIFFYVTCLNHRASPMQPLAALTGLEV